MLGINILVHSIKQIFGNLREVIRIIWLPMLATAVLQYGILSFVTESGFDRRLPSDEEFSQLFYSYLAVGLIEFLLWTWVAVAWHRFILLSEYPGVTGAVHGGRMAAYIWGGIKAVLIALVILILPIIGYVYVLANLFGPQFSQSPASVQWAYAFTVAMVPVFLFMAAVMFRLLSALPGVAIGTVSVIWQGWEKTKGHWLDLIVLAFGLAIVSWPISLLPDGVMLLPVPLSSNILLLAVSISISYCLTSLVGLSILTTLYGHFFEDRPLQ